MANVTGASLSGIYDRLHGTASYHPLEADTFADWSVEAGDLVTLKRGNETYQSPIHQSKMVWNGAPTVSINSKGNQKREAISRVSKQKYRKSAAGMNNEYGIYSYVYAADSQIYSYVVQTATYIVSHLENEISDVGSEILQTANEIRTEVHAANSQLYSYVDQTATYISQHVEDVANNLGSEILQTASQIYSTVYASNSKLYSYVDQTATYISSHVDNVESDLHSEILQTQCMIHSAVWTANSMVFSYVDQTATNIYSHVGDVESGLHSEIEQTAENIYTAVYAADSNIYSYVNQTSTNIYSHVGDVESGLHSEIEQTAENIYSAVYASESSVYSYVDQTATYINQAVVNTVSGLQSNIEQQADRISLVVQGTGSNAKIKAASIAASINSQTGQSAVKLSADIIDIDGLVENLRTKNIIVKDIQATGNADFATIFVVGTSEFQGNVTCDNALSVNGYDVKVSDISISNNVMTIYYTDGTTETFEKAASIDYLTGAWSGSGNSQYLVVSTYPSSGKTYTIGFGDNDNTKLRLLTNGTPTINTDSKYLDVPMRVATADGSGPVTITTRYSETFTVNATPVWNDGNAAGYSTGYSTGYSNGIADEKALVRTRFNTAEGSYFAEAYESSSGNSIANSSTTYQLGTTGSTSSTKVQIQTTAGVKIDHTPELSVGSLYTDGYSSAKISTSWSNNVFSYSKSTSGSTSGSFSITSRFASGSGNYYIEAAKTEGGSTAGITNTTHYYKLGTSGSTSSTKVQIQETNGTQITGTPELSVGSLYTDGYSSAKVSTSWSNNVFSYSRSTSGSTSGSFSISSRFGVSNGSYYIEAAKTEGGSTSSIGSTSTTYKLGTSGSTSSTKVQIQTTAGVQIVDTPEISVGSLYTSGHTAGVTDGKNAVTINKGSWSNAQVTFTKSEGTASTKGVKVGLTGSWSGNSYSYTIKDYYDNAQGVSTGYTGTIDASGRYTAGVADGKNAVTINKGSWSNAQVTFTKSEGTASTKGVKVGLTGSWSGNSYSYTIKDYYDNAQGVSTGYTGTIDASGRYNTGYTDGISAVYTSAYWVYAKASNNWTCYTPNSTNTASEVWGKETNAVHAAYKAGFEAGWSAYYTDSHWQPDYYNTSTQKYEAWRPAGQTTFTYGNTVETSTHTSAWEDAAWFTYSDTTPPSPSYNVTFPSSDTAGSKSSDQVYSYLSGWNPKLLSGGTVPNSQQNKYRYIKFYVDGKKRSFYFS